MGASVRMAGSGGIWPRGGRQGAADIRSVLLDADNATFYVGDHLGFSDATLEALRDATVIGVGPVSVHADDAIVIVANELDRRVEQRTSPLSGLAC